jgi:hypothetical protein
MDVLEARGTDVDEHRILTERDWAFSATFDLRREVEFHGA